MVVTRRAAAAREAAGGSSSSNVARPAASPANQRPSSPPARAQSPRSKTGVARSRSRVRVSSRAPRAAEKRAPSPLREEGASLSRAGPQKLRIASRAQVIDDGASSKAEDAAGEAGPRRGGLRGRSLSKRLQTGPLPSVRNLSGFTDDGEEEQFPTSVAAQQGRQAGGSQELPGVSGETLVSAENSDRLPRGKLTQLLLSYCCYASLYLTRKPFANAKSTLQLQLGLTTSALGVVDSAFLGAYALSQLFLGPFLSSHFSSRMERVLAGAFAVSAFSSAVVGMLPTQAVNVYSLSTAWALNGAAQALAFPFIVALLTGWLLPQEKGGVLGAWATCQQLGSIFASFLTGQLLDSPYVASFFEGEIWRAVFVLPAVWVLVCALLIAFAIRAAAAPLASQGEGEGGSGSRGSAGGSKRKESKQGRRASTSSVGRALALTSVRCLCASYFFVKLSRYAVLYWLPFFLEQHANLSAADAAFYCTYFDAGGAVGSVLLGYLTDRLLRGRRMPLVVPLCVLGGLALVFFFWATPPGSAGAASAQLPAVAQAALLVAGAAIAGPDSVLGGASTADACAEADANDVATSASCLVNGCGSVGPIVQSLSTALLINNFGWLGVFVSVGASAVLGALPLLPQALRELRSVRRRATRRRRDKDDLPPRPALKAIESLLRSGVQEASVAKYKSA